MNSRALFLSVLLAMALGGCGDDTAPHGVSPTRSVDDLDDAEILAVCEDLYLRPVEAIIPSEREACTLAAVVTTASLGHDEAYCRDILSICLADAPPIEPVEPLEPGDCPTSADLAGCELTVAEIDDCTDAMEKLANDLWSFSCSDLNVTEPELPDADTLPECQHLEDVCPDVFGG